jgi:hypothetical protein
MGWTAALIRDVIKRYGDADRSQRVTLHGVTTDLRQQKEVTRWPTKRRGFFGQLWYDLNIDAKASDLTATFSLKRTGDLVTFHLNDIHVTEGRVLRRSPLILLAQCHQFDSSNPDPVT